MEVKKDIRSSSEIEKKVHKGKNRADEQESRSNKLTLKILVKYRS